jgi:hypothetical protein
MNPAPSIEPAPIHERGAICTTGSGEFQAAPPCFPRHEVLSSDDGDP